MTARTPTPPPPPPPPPAIPIIVARHAEEAATRWWRRESAYIDNRRTPFEELVAYDQMIDAHLDGLREAGQAGWDAVIGGITKARDNNAPDAGADIFAALALTFLHQDDDTLARMLAYTDELAGKAEALEAVFGWNDAPIVTAALEAHLGHADRRHRHAALAQCHAHGHSGGDHLAAMLAREQPDSVARAIRTAGECGRVDLLPDIRAWCEQGRRIPEIRFWSAWASVLLGDAHEDAIGALQTSVAHGDAHRREALQALCIALPAQRLRTLLAGLPQAPIEPSLLFDGVGWSGQTAYAGWLLEQMRIAPLARLAAEAFRLITGFDCEENDAAIDAPEPDAGGGTDAAFPYPYADKAARWWAEQEQEAADAKGRGDAAPAARLFLGRAVTLEWLDTVLDQGEQAHREFAALQRAILKPGGFLVPTRAHAMVQWMRLQQLKEKP